MPTRETPHPLVEPGDSGVWLRLPEAAGGGTLLSIEQARALSLALISAVNRQERERHARARRPVPLRPQPGGR